MCTCVYERVCRFVANRVLAALIHKAFETCFPHLFLGPSPFLLSPSVRRADSWAGVCHVFACRAVCWSVLAFPLLCRYQSVGASRGDCGRHYLGNVYEHQPGGQQVRDSRWGGAVCFLSCSLLIFESFTIHLSSIFLLLCLFLNRCHKHAKTNTHGISLRLYVLYTRAHTDAHVPTQHVVFFYPADTTGEDMMCHKYIGSCTQIALLP